MLIYQQMNEQSSDVGWGLNYLDILPQFFSEAGGMNILSGAILFILFFIGMLLYKNKGMKLIYLLPLIITPILTIFINISTRYLIYFIPFYVIMLSYPLIKIDKKFMKACYCILILFLLFPGLQTVTQESKIDYRGAANYISENIDINTQIIVLPLTRENCFKYYYHGNNTISSFEPYDINGLELTLSKKTWIIQTGVAEYGTGNDVMSVFLNDNCDIIKKFTKLTLYEYQPIKEFTSIS